MITINKVRMNIVSKCNELLLVSKVQHELKYKAQFLVLSDSNSTLIVLNLHQKTDLMEL